MCFSVTIKPLMKKAIENALDYFRKHTVTDIDNRFLLTIYFFT